MEGILLVHKPVGWTSFDVVGRLRHIIASEQKVKPRNIKIGHAGTLDPLAQGLLVILIGKSYTKMAERFSKLDKEYLFDMRLGEVTVSGDKEFEPKVYSSKKPLEKEVEQTLESFIGQINQKPPIYSALKVDGQRAYKLARAGQEVTLKSRPVNIYRLELVSYQYPNLSLRTKVSSGTYIRSLVMDIGEKLGTGAYMSKLTRTSIGDFKLDQAIKIKNISYNLLCSNLIFV